MRGRPRRELEKDTKRTGHSWKQLEKIARDRGDWGLVIGGLAGPGGVGGGGGVKNQTE